jgi:DNA polymerase III subunit delta
VAKKAPGRPAPVHVVLGEDTYLAEETLERILADAIGAERAEGLTVLYGDEVRWEGVLQAARAGSLFTNRRAILVRRAELLRYEGQRAGKPEEDRPDGPPSGRARGKPAAEDAVGRYLDAPAPDATLVLVAAKPDRRRNPWKRLCTDGTVHSVEPMRRAALRSYVEENLRRRGLRLTGDALSALLDEVGQDLRRLMGEVDKLEAWAAADEKPTLSADDVLEVLGRGMARPLYLLADAVAARDLAGTMERTEELLAGGEEGLRILATAHRSLRQVRAARALRERRLPRPEIGSRLLPPNMQFKLESLLAAASRWTDEDLRHALASLGRADRRMKRGSDAATALVAALAEACRGGAGATSRRGR